MNRRRGLAGVGAGLAAVLLLAACASRGPLPARPDVRATSNATAPAPAAADAALRGQILLPAGSALPAGARLQLRLVDRFGDAASAVLAESEQAVDTPVPVPFELPFHRDAIRDISVYRLEVALFDAAGRLAFVSDGEHPVNLGPDAEPTRIELMAVSTAGVQRLPFDCDGLRGELRIADPALQLLLPTGNYALRRAHSASGLRYAGAEAELWMKGDGLLVQVGETRYRCRLQLH